MADGIGKNHHHFAALDEHEHDLSNILLHGSSCPLLQQRSASLATNERNHFVPEVHLRVEQLPEQLMGNVLTETELPELDFSPKNTQALHKPAHKHKHWTCRTAPLVQ